MTRMPAGPTSYRRNGSTRIDKDMEASVDDDAAPDPDDAQPDARVDHFIAKLPALQAQQSRTVALMVSPWGPS